MRYVELIVREDNSTGEVGLVVKGTPNLSSAAMVSLDGRLIAHDLLEHVNGVDEIGSIDDELQALGACWFIRGQYADIARNAYSVAAPEEALARDVANLGEYYVNGVNFRNPVPHTRYCRFDDNFQSIIEEARPLIVREFECRDVRLDFKRMREFLDSVLPWMRLGYRKANRRYESATTANSMFWNIAEAVDGIKHEIEWPGQTFRLGYERNNATCREVWDDYGY